MVGGPVKTSEVLDRRIATLLGSGTLAACAVMAFGMIVQSMAPAHGVAIITGGIGLLVALPVFRVAVMLASFLHDGDHQFAILAGLVLLIIAVSVTFGAYAV